MNKMNLKVGDVVQIAQGTTLFGGCFMTVLVVETWGAEGFIYVPRNRLRPPTEAHFRARWDQMEYVGHSQLAPV